MIKEKKGFNRRTIFYNDEFKEEMEKFFGYINLDQELDSLSKNKAQRFSVAVRKLIITYNKKFGDRLTERSKERDKGIKEGVKKATGYY